MLEELFSVWDYKGKLEARSWTQSITWDILGLRLSLPPGKIVPSFSHAAFKSRLSCDHELPPESLIDSAGLTKDVLFSKLELTAKARAMAALEDDREVNFALLAEPGKSPALERAQELCRKAALRIWKRHLECEARDWLAQRPLGRREPRDVAADEDCIRRA